MKFLKSLFAFFAFFAFAAFAPVSAAEIADVDAEYWANVEITDMVEKEVMGLVDGNFNPEASVERGNFVKMLVKVLGHNDLAVKVSNPYTDIGVTTKNYTSIMKSEEIGLVYGYPDGTFKPENKMTKAEVTSVMSHITKSMTADETVLDQFEDKDLIPAWANAAYAKSVKYGLYVNHPEALMLEPNREITRAEVAVLLYKLSKTLNVVKTEYVSKETTNSTEHLNIHPEAESNIVTVTNLRKIIASGNILKTEFAQVYKSKKSAEGDEVVFVVRNDVLTNEGTTVIPAASKFYATVEDIKSNKWFNKVAEVKFHFTRLELPDGRTADVDAYIYNNRDGYLRENPWKKVALCALGGTIVGTGAGMAIGIPNDETGTGFAVGTPAGFGAGTILGLVTKGVNYKANEGETVFIKVLNNVSINEDL